MRLSNQALLAVLASSNALPWAAVAFTAPSLAPKRSLSVAAFSRGGQRTSTTTPLFGILDEVNSDAYDLLGGSSKSDSSGGGGGTVSKDLDQAYEIFLAELVFSPNDPRMDIYEKLDMAGDPMFMAWLNNKAMTSVDPEERMAMRDLHEMISDVKQKIELSAKAEERERLAAEEAERLRVEAAEEKMGEGGKAMSNTDVLRQAARVDTGAIDDAVNKAAADAEEEKKEKKTFLESDISPEIRLSYEKLVKELLPPYKAGDTATTVVYKNYDQCDAQLLKVLEERVSNGDNDSRVVLDAIAEEQGRRVEKATEVLKSVLSLGEPMKMEGAIVRLAREQKIDEPFLLLLEANANQAEAAGAKGPAELMKRLKNRAMEEKDKQSEKKELQLLRKLLRTEASEDREKILEDAFTPREQLLVQGTAENAAKALDGEAMEEQKAMPDVPPPDFINACKAILLNFGNLATEEKGDLTTMVKKIASEAEVVATRIYGKGMSPREQQDRMYKEATTSIFDLETLEIEAERMGDTAPWTNPDNDDILPGFDKDGRMQVGGS